MNVLPLKRPTILKSPNIFSLLSLPDEALSVIFHHLHASPLTFTSLPQACHAFSLAITNHRLFRLFCSSITTLDATPDIPLRVHLSPVTAAPHLRLVVWLAASALRILHLPPFRIPLAQDVLDAAASCASGLRVLSFVDHDFDKHRMMVLYDRCPRLSHIQISLPTYNALYALTQSTCNLDVLVLVDVAPCLHVHVTNLIHFKAAHLRVLNLAFDILPDASHQYHDQYNQDCTPYAQLSLFILDLFDCIRNMPHLHTLHLSASPLSSLQHPPQETVAPNLPDFIHNTINKIHKARAYNQEHRYTSSLVSLTLGAQASRLSHVLHLLALPFSPSANIQVITSGFTLISPPNEHPYVHSLLFGDYMGLKTNNSTLEIASLHTLNVWDEGALTYKMSATLQQRSQCQATFARIANLQCLRVRYKRRDNYMSSFLNNFVRDVALAAPHLKILEISPGLLCEASSSDQWRPAAQEGNAPLGQRVRIWGVLDELPNLRILRLLRTRLFLLPKVHPDDCPGNFLNMLPGFLKILVVKCPRLESLFLEGMVDLDSSICCFETRMSIHSALYALQHFEEALPNVEVSTVQQQLRKWNDQCY